MQDARNRISNSGEGCEEYPEGSRQNAREMLRSRSGKRLVQLEAGTWRTPEGSPEKLRTDSTGLCLNRSSEPLCLGVN